MSRLLDVLRQDFSWLVWRDGDEARPVDWSWARLLWRCLKNRSMRAVFLHRLAHRAHVRGHRVRAAVWSGLLYRMTGAQVAAACRIGGGLRMPHPQGIVVGAGVEVGTMVTINQHVTLGGNFGKENEHGRRFPRIGDRCWICAGAVIAGPIDIGANTLIGANSVVTRSIPANSVVGGVPAEVLRPREPDASPRASWVDSEEETP